MVSQNDMLGYFSPQMSKRGNLYRKKSLIRAKKATPEMEVTTKTSDGDETKNFAKEGDWLVENQTSSNERYLVKAETFEKKYKMIQSLDRGWGVFESTGKTQALEFTEEDLKKFNCSEKLEFEAPWQQSMLVRPGDFLVIPDEKNEIYRVAKKEFNETYKKV